MKKLSIMFAALALAIGFTACDSETKPVLQVPEQEEGAFVLNTPQLANQYLQLINGGSTEFICSQPDYGVALSVTYGLQMSLTEDFEKFVDMKPSTPTSTTISIPDRTIAANLCILNGYDDELVFNNGNADKPAYDGKPITIYLRATCQVPNAPQSLLHSNVVALKQVVYYYATLDPNCIWIIGDLPGASWLEPSEANAEKLEPYQVWETGYNTNEFVGTFKMNAGTIFRFYTALTGWEQDSLGQQVPDEAKDFEFENDVFTGDCVKGKGAWRFPDFPGGYVEVHVNLEKMTVEFLVVPEPSTEEE